MAHRIRRFALLAAVLSLTASPVLAQDRPDETPPKDSLTEQTEKAFRQSIEAIMKALEKLVDSVPLYEAPEVLENGDIIIRRKHREETPKEEEAPDTSRT